MNSLTWLNGNYYATWVNSAYITVLDTDFNLIDSINTTGLIPGWNSFQDITAIDGDLFLADRGTQSIYRFTECLDCPQNVPEIPIPASIWLFGSGLIGLIGVARRKKV